MRTKNKGELFFTELVNVWFTMATEGVLKYLQSTNRPYSANDIVLNMHKEFGKTAVQKALDDLVTQAQVLEKAYGKQKIYCVKQPDDKSAGETELTDLDSEVSMDFVLLYHHHSYFINMQCV